MIEWIVICATLRKTEQARSSSGPLWKSWVLTYPARPGHDPNPLGGQSVKHRNIPPRETARAEPVIGLLGGDDGGVSVERTDGERMVLVSNERLEPGFGRKRRCLYGTLSQAKRIEDLEEVDVGFNRRLWSVLRVSLSTGFVTGAAGKCREDHHFREEDRNHRQRHGNGPCSRSQCYRV